MDENYVINRKHIDLIRKAKQLTARNAKSWLSGAILRSTRLKALLPGAFVAMNILKYNSAVAIFA